MANGERMNSGFPWFGLYARWRICEGQNPNGRLQSKPTSTPPRTCCARAAACLHDTLGVCPFRHRASPAACAVGSISTPSCDARTGEASLHQPSSRSLEFSSPIHSSAQKQHSPRLSIPNSQEPQQNPGESAKKMLLLFLLFLLVGAAAFLLFKFATVVDGDLTLVSHGPPRRERVDGKVVWITGASRGIGEVLSMQFANLGAKLILSARNEDELERVKQNILSKNPDSRIEVLPMDLSAGEESLKQVVHAAESLFSNAGIDYMIHNAAFERPKRGALEESEGGLKATFNVNVIGTINLTRLLAPYMLDRGMGHFVVMNSAAGKVPAPGQAVYSASKHALNGYFASLRSELCTKGIKVTVVCPGPIQTPQSAGAASSIQSHSSEKRVSVERCAELTIVAATHGLKEAWISYQPVLTVMYLVQYMPTIGYWLMDKIGAKRLDAAAKKGNTYSWNLMFGGKKSA